MQDLLSAMKIVWNTGMKYIVNYHVVELNCKEIDFEHYKTQNSRRSIYIAKLHIDNNRRR